MTQTTQTRDKIIKMLKDRGCRMTKQRRILLDIILEDNCSSCKEIYYRASRTKALEQQRYTVCSMHWRKLARLQEKI